MDESGRNPDQARFDLTGVLNTTTRVDRPENIPALAEDENFAIRISRYRADGDRTDLIIFISDGPWPDLPILKLESPLVGADQ